MIERAAGAHRAGLDSLFVGDQHVSSTQYYQNTPMLGRLLAGVGQGPSRMPVPAPFVAPGARG